MVEEKKGKKVQIKVTLETREWLKQRGSKGQSYEDVIVEALMAVERKNSSEEDKEEKKEKREKGVS